MESLPDGQVLIDAFLAALQRGELEACAAKLQQLRSLVETRPAFAPWCAYLAGILANERDHNLAEAERIFRELLAGELEPALRGRALYALGRTYDYQARWADAIDTFERCHALALRSGDTLEQVKAWKHIAISYNNGFACGDFGPEVLAVAARHCQDALDSLRALDSPAGEHAWLTGSIWNTLGLVRRSLGEWDAALACYRQDLKLCRAQGDRLGIGLSYGNIGEVYQEQGPERWPRALAAYRRALRTIRAFARPLDEAEVLANLGFLHQAMGEPELALEHYHHALRIVEDLRVAPSTEAARAGFFATIVDTYANAVLLCLSLGDERQAFDLVERARARTFLDALATRARALSQRLAGTPLTGAEVQAALPADALLLEYFTTGLPEASAGRFAMPYVRRRFPPASTILFAVTRSSLRAFPLDISPGALRPDQLDRAAERHFLEPEVRRELYERLLAPAEPLLGAMRRLYLVPHGPLHYVPFQALIDRGGATLLDPRGPELMYAPSATILLGDHRPVDGTASQGCLALGYNGSAPRRLRFAEEEARLVARLTAGEALAGPGPKLARLYEQAAGCHILHLSCHGGFIPQAPLSSWLELGPDERLTALDVLERLRLRCALVTISACESGLSRVRRGDELVGLVRAFLYAGTPLLLCTLWEVDERSTSILMERFYQEYQAGVPAAEALKRAQLFLKTLSRSQALDILLRYAIDQILHYGAPPSDEWPASPGPAPEARLAESYLKSVGAEVAPAASADDGPGAAAERLFADPYYWAPFILVASAQGALVRAPG